MPQARSRIRRLAAAAVLLASATGYAHTTPQWTRGLIQAERRDDQVMLRHSWSATADGGSVVSSDSTLWRFRADGSTQFINTLPGLRSFSGGLGGTLLLARDETQDATYVAASTGGSCLLLRVDAGGLQQWTLEPAGSAAGVCTALTVAADGSAILTRERALARIARDGQVLWHRGDLQTRTTGIGALLLIDAQSRIVTPRYEGSQTFLARYELSGAPVADIALPASAQPATIHGLDVLPNGDIAVVGREDLTGVLYLLAPSHTLRLLQRSADALPYTRSVNDGATVYVQAGDSMPPGAEQVRAIDALSGALRWHLPAKEVVAARASGVTIVQRPIQPSPASMQLIALDSSGNGDSARALALGANDLVHGGRDASGNPRLLALPLERGTDCGKALTVLVLAADGSTQARHAACTREIFWPLRGLDAEASAGALVQTQAGVQSLGQGGSPRWNLFDCPYCTAAERPQVPVNSSLIADGGAWVLQYNRADNSQFVERRTGSGGVLFWAPLPIDFATQGPLHTSGNSARIVGSGGNSVRLMLLTDGIGLQFGPEIVVPGSSALRQPRTRQLPNGDIAVEVRRAACGFPACQPDEATLLLLAPDGSERWRFQSLMYGYGSVQWNDDGSALVINRYPTATVRFVSAQGVAAEPQPLAFAIDQIVGPSQGRWLARDSNGLLYLGDAQGVFAAAPMPHALTRLLGAGSQGFLVDAVGLNADAALLEPQQLATLASFDATGLPYPGSTEASGRWRLLDDGSLYGETFEALPPERSLSAWRVHVSRFAVPGSPADDRVFTDSFE